MKTINIKGKDYVMVNERIKEFRANYKGYSLESEIVTLNAEEVVIKAIVKDENGRVIATGLAQENKNASMINKTSYVENCETSAWGRALGNLGIGIDASIASAEEMVNALSQQEIPKPASDFNKPKGTGGEFIMPHGKHQGKMLKDISDDYLTWYLEKGTSKETKDNINLMRNGLQEIDNSDLPF